MPETPPLPRLLDLSHDELECWCESKGEAKYRAAQIRHWLFAKRVSDIAGMIDVPARLRQSLRENFSTFSTAIIDHRVARDRTEKLLLALDSGDHVECVLMREPRRRTVCISTQVGCAMGCVFCASGLLGLRERKRGLVPLLDSVAWGVQTVIVPATWRMPPRGIRLAAPTADGAEQAALGGDLNRDKSLSDVENGESYYPGFAMIPPSERLEHG